MMLSGREGYAQSGFPYCESFTNSFTRANTIYGGNSAGLTSGNGDPEGEGVLRLTSNGSFQSGFVYVDIPLSSRFGFKTSFEYFSYGGNGADGFSFFLFDAAVEEFKVGSYGGALGYANSNNPISEGLLGGYIGIGFDEYGNFGNTKYGKAGGFGENDDHSLFNNSVVIRGPHSEGYRFIEGRRTFTSLNGGLEGIHQFPIASGGVGTTRVTNPNQVGYRKVFIDMLPAANGIGFTITLKMQVTTTANSPRMVTIFDAVTYPFAPPRNLKIGFAGSTGGRTNFHEIRNLIVEVSDDENLQNPITNDKSHYSCYGQEDVIEIDALKDVVLTNDTGNNFIRCVQLGESIEDFLSVNEDICNTVQCDLAKQQISTSKGVFTANEEGKITFVPVSDFTQGEVLIYYTVTDNFGKTSDPKAISITVIPMPEASISTEDDTDFYVGDKASLKANDGENLLYQWFKDGEVILNATDATFQAYESGVYHVVKENEFGCEKTSNTILLTTENPPALMGGLLNTKPEICQSKGEATFNIQNVFQPAYYKVIRSGGEIIHDWTLLSDEDLVLANLDYGEYSLLVYDRFRSVEEPVSSDFAIFDERNPILELFDYKVQGLDSKGIILANEIVIFESHSNGENFQYEWDFGDGKGSQQMNPKHSFAAQGVYLVQMTATNALGCKSTVEMRIEVKESHLIMTPNAFTPLAYENQTFRPKLRGIATFEMYIFNTWGDLLYVINSMEDPGWDGKVNGQLGPNGNYIYKANFSTVEGKKVTQSGVFTLIR